MESGTILLLLLLSRVLQLQYYSSLWIVVVAAECAVVAASQPQYGTLTVGWGVRGARCAVSGDLDCKT